MADQNISSNQVPNPMAQSKPKENSSAMSNFFGGSEKTPAVDPKQIAELSSQVKNLTSRLRSLEEKYRNLKNEFTIAEKNTLEDHKKSSIEFRDVNDQIFELKKSFNQTKTQMEIIIKELGLTAKKESVLTIQKYLDLWNPVNFVSQIEIKNIVKRSLHELGIETKNDVKVLVDETSVSEGKKAPDYEPDLRQ